MSKFRNSVSVIALAGALLAAWMSQPIATHVHLTAQVENPIAPQPGDATMMHRDIDMVSASVLKAESLPPQISISFAYRLPTPCYHLRVSISQPSSQNRVQLEIYGVAPKNKPCNLMTLLTPLETSISLGSFPSGHYTIWINGKQVGEFDAQ